MPHGSSVVGIYEWNGSTTLRALLSACLLLLRLHSVEAGMFYAVLGCTVGSNLHETPLEDAVRGVWCVV